MVNARVVNGGSLRSKRGHFGVFPRDSGRFLHSQNPFKYKRNREINHKTARRPSGNISAAQILTRQINSLRRVNASEKRLRYNGGLRGPPAHARNRQAGGGE
jgi:hypothetical protein